MSIVPTPQSQASDETEAYDLSTPEEIARRKRRKRLLVWGVVLALLGTGAGFGGRPAYRAVRDWQARRAASQAQREMDAGHWNEAMTKVQDSLALSRIEPEVMRTAAAFLSRTGHGREALGFWRQVEKVRPLTIENQRDYLASLLAADELDAAGAKLRTVWPPGKEGTPTDWRLGLQLALQRRQNAEAISLAQRLIKSPASSEQHRFDAAQVLVASNSAEVQKSGWDAVESISRGSNPLSLEALLLLARREASMAKAAQNDKNQPPRTAEVETLAKRIEAHPLAKTSQQLLAEDLRLTAEPGRREELVKAAVERFGHGDDDAVATLGGWLYAQGEYQRVLDLIPPERATASRALYLQYLDTLGAMGRWQVVKDSIEGQKFTLDPILEQMYLARCLERLGQVEGSALHWDSAVQAAGTNVERLLTVGRYAQRNGAMKPAEAAVRAALAAAPDSHPTYEALLEMLQAQGHTAAMRDTLKAMLKTWPNDASVRNDLAYLDALLNQNVTASRDVARALVRAEPNSLPHRVTLALAELRLGHPLTGLDALGQVPLSALATQGRYLAVYIAVVRGVGSYDKEIKAAMQALDQTRLLPEEQALVRE